jgi:hypothetical protein
MLVRPATCMGREPLARFARLTRPPGFALTEAARFVPAGNTLIAGVMRQLTPDPATKRR